MLVVDNEVREHIDKISAQMGRDYSDPWFPITKERSKVILK